MKTININANMKKVYCFFIPILFLCSCSNNDEPEIETPLPIVKEYSLSTMQINESEFDENYLKLAVDGLVVTELSELPADPFGFNKAFMSIDFSKHILLLHYLIHDWKIDTYRNIWYWNNYNEFYGWEAAFMTSTKQNTNPDNCYFTRCAILVNKLPENARVKCLMSLGSIN